MPSISHSKFPDGVTNAPLSVPVTSTWRSAAVERAAASVPAPTPRLPNPDSGRPRRHRPGVQRTPSTDPRLQDTIASIGRGVALTAGTPTDLRALARVPSTGSGSGSGSGSTKATACYELTGERCVVRPQVQSPFSTKWTSGDVRLRHLRIQNSKPVQRDRDRGLAMPGAAVSTTNSRHELPPRTEVRHDGTGRVRLTRRRGQSRAR